MNQSAAEPVPAWMKAMQNGGLAEARARAFLMNRFWILERSVDVNGADFLIQRRITKSNFLDDNAPRLGVVQVKFFESSATTHKIHEEYILDREGKPREEFFILFHSGNENQNEIYFMTASDVAENFFVNEDKDIRKFSIPGTKVLNGLKYKVVDNKLVLDRMENHLQRADFRKNRDFISWSLPQTAADLDNIIPDFKEPIQNWWGSLPEGFLELKTAVKKSMDELSDLYEKLKNVVEEPDPIKAIAIVEDLESDYGGNMEWRVRLPEELQGWEFIEVCRQHREKLDWLKRDGLLDTFLSLKGKFDQAISGFLAAKLPLEDGFIHWFKFEANDQFGLKIGSHHITIEASFFNGQEDLEPFKESKYIGVVLLSPGSFLAYWNPTIMMSHTDRTLPDYLENAYMSPSERSREAIYDEKYYQQKYHDFQPGSDNNDT